MTKQNKIKTIVFLFSSVVLLAIIYFGIHIKNTLDNANNYTNKQYGFSLTYPANTDTIEELPNGVTFWKGDKSQNLWDIAVYADSITKIDPKITDVSQEVTNINNDIFVGSDNKQVIDKRITIDRYPAIVTSIKNIVTGTEVNQEKQVFFIKDKLLFTIFTYGYNEALWSSFRFTK